MRAAEESITHPGEEEDLWHVIYDNVQRGPVSYEVVLGLIVEGKAGAGDFVWTPGYPDWKKIGSTREFAQYVGALSGERTSSRPDFRGGEPVRQFCQYCGAKNLAEATFCSRCGISLEQEEAILVSAEAEPGPSYSYYARRGLLRGPSHVMAFLGGLLMFVSLFCPWLELGGSVQTILDSEGGQGIFALTCLVFLFGLSNLRKVGRKRSLAVAFLSVFLVILFYFFAISVKDNADYFAKTLAPMHQGEVPVRSIGALDEFEQSEGVRKLGGIGMALFAAGLVVALLFSMWGTLRELVTRPVSSLILFVIVSIVCGSAIMMQRGYLYDRLLEARFYFAGFEVKSMEKIEASLTSEEPLKRDAEKELVTGYAFEVSKDGASYSGQVVIFKGSFDVVVDMIFGRPVQDSGIILVKNSGP
ncbi:MAG: GYF domain-containing protein [Planctomycetes bacterium]|nr:GYF domain-containing protein [Planctomycetota bacterium]